MFTLDRVDRQLGNLAEMMERLGLDPAAVARHRLGFVVSSAVKTCQACPSGDVCRDWLLRATPTLQKAPAFCPNAGRFAELLVNQMSADFAGRRH